MAFQDAIQPGYLSNLTIPKDKEFKGTNMARPRKKKIERVFPIRIQVPSIQQQQEGQSLMGSTFMALLIELQTQTIIDWKVLVEVTLLLTAQRDPL